MSYFPEDIPFMSEEERRFYGIRIPKEKRSLSFVPTEEEAEEIFGIKGLMKMLEEKGEEEFD